MVINTNAELSKTLRQIIDDNGIKKVWLADKIGIQNQNLNRLLDKKNLSLDDANRVLHELGYSAKIIIEKD